MSLSERFYRTSKTKKKMFALFVAFVILLMFGQIIAHAEVGIDDDVLSEDVRQWVEIRTGYNDIIRKAELGILIFLSEAIDYFDSAVTTVSHINLYNAFVKSKLNIDNDIYPLAWALFSLALIILGIIFIWNNDKVRITESAKSIIMSALIIIALPSFFGALDEMKEIGMSDVGTVGYNSEQLTLGDNLLLKSVVDLEKSYTTLAYVSDAAWVNNILEDNKNKSASELKPIIDSRLQNYINLTASHNEIGYYYEGSVKQFLEDAPEGDIDKFIATIKNMGYPAENAYKYHIDFWYNLVLMTVTIVCLIFAGVKLAGMLFNLLFMQIISPIVAATDLNGSGRAKKIVQNILSTYIIFIVVILLLRLYIIVIQGMRTKDYNFAVMLMLTIAGAKFVIDGPDIIVQILGIDAGVKSGAATLMGLHSAAQMANGVVKGSANAVRNVAAVPAKVSETVGKAAAVSNEIASANGIGGKLKAAAGNSHVGQAFKQAYSGQSQTNDLYNDAKAKYKAPQNSEPAAEPMKSQEQGSKYNSSAETGSVGQSVNQNEHSSERNNATAQTATTQSTATQGKAFENQHQNNNSPSSSEDAANHSQQSQSSVSEPTFPQQEMSSEREKTTFAQSEYSSEQSNNVQAKSEQPKKEEMNNGNDTQTNEK